MRASHEQSVALLQKQIRELSSTNLCLSNAKTSSNTTRNAPYKLQASRLDISHLDRVVEVDQKNKTALVQPRISMYALCKALLPLGLVPKVVPEFKGITVGGAINGCGGESNSHRVGLFHNNCLEYELILASGDKIHASCSNHSDLFEALHGSYGSLALLTSAKIALSEASSFVRVRYKRFSDIHAAIDYMRNGSDAEFLEGIVFSEQHAVIIEGWPADEVHGTLRHFSQASSPWFYQHARTQKDNHEEYLPLIDYLFRYDQGAFWMGAYVMRPGVLLPCLLEGVLKVKSEPEKWLNDEEVEDYATIQDPGVFQRYLSASCMQSQPLYRLLHKAETWVQRRFIVQDLTLPESKAVECLDYLCKECPIFPLWLCPVTKSSPSQLFCPTSLETSDAKCLNIGVYGIANSQKPTSTLLASLEEKVSELQGRKWLYTNSEYTHEQFWKIYSKESYQAIRDKYDSGRLFVSIDQKVLA